jgi:fermentation-respiration switch protein FrsA (DUF1100 family)
MGSPFFMKNAQVAAFARAARIPALLATLSAASCSHIFYQPSSDLFFNPHQAHLNFEEVSFKASDGTKLVGWYFPASPERPHLGTIVQFHGNAENMTSHFASLVWAVHSGYDLLAFDYRGYGKSEGNPSQEGVNLDAVAAIHYAQTRNPTPLSRDLVLYGQSLGGAILLRALDDVRDRSRILAVVVDSTFYSYRAMGRAFLAQSFITWLFQPLACVLISDAYQPRDSIARVAPLPLLVIHGDVDPVVPFSMGQKVYELAGSPKTFWPIAGGHHVDSMEVEDRRYRDLLLAYLAKLR